MDKIDKVLKYTGKIKVLTGLHIGAGNDAVEIGGSDSPVIKDKISGMPYIPGSSVKGRMRWILEKSRGEYAIDQRRNEGVPGDDPNKVTTKLFGSNSANTTVSPTRVIFRDCYLTSEFVKKFKDGEWDIELKMENTIDRISGKTRQGGLRNSERVPAGVVFDFNMGLLIIEGDNEAEFKKVIEEGIKLLELTYIGGSGSRGYGSVKFEEMKWE